MQERMGTRRLPPRHSQDAGSLGRETVPGIAHLVLAHPGERETGSGFDLIF